jgi:hypothetical protein
VKQAVALSGEKAATPQNSPPVDYALISDHNLFHPERKMPLEKQPETVIPKPDLFLYGTLISNDESFAFIENKKSPYSTAGRGKRQVTVKKGDNVSGYILSGIEANRIVLVKGEDTVVVMLNDKEKRRAGEASALPATARTAPGGTAPFQPAASSFPQAAPSPGPGMGVPGSRLPTQPFVSPSLPAAAVSSPQAVMSPGAETGPASGPSTRRGKVQEIQKIKAGGLTIPGN